MDGLSSTLAAARTGPARAVSTSVHAPFGLRLRPIAGMGVHAVLHGRCHLLPSSGGQWTLQEGDLVVLRSGQGHVLAEPPDAPTTDFEPDPVQGPAVGRVTVAGDGAFTHLLCGAYLMEQRSPHPLLAQLPSVIHLPGAIHASTAIRALVDLLRAEIEEPRGGGAAASAGLVDTLLVFALRYWVERCDGRHPLTDPAVSVAIEALHGDPVRSWTVDDLARRASVSRSVFARRFTELMAESPMRYLVTWRATLAAEELRNTDATLAAIAERVGFASEFALSKAFKQRYGIAPGAYRRAAADEDLDG